MPRFAMLGLTLCALLPASCSSPGECAADRDCDDADPCTADRCRLERCSHLSTPFCCRTDTDCSDPVRSQCDPDSGRCVQCLDDAACPAGQSCSPESHLCEERILMPGPPCTDDVQCETAWCLAEISTGFPGGLCGQECSQAAECASGVCIDIMAGVKTCLAPCSSDEHCRPAYMCLAVGPGQAACFPRCSSDSHCPEVGQCNRWIGMCGSAGPGADNGAPCDSDEDCKGFCVTEQSNGAPGGVCVSLCSPGRTSCPGAGERCLALFSPYLFGQSVCLPPYQPQSGCREHYVPMVAFDLADQVPRGVCQPACRPGDCRAENCNPDTGLCSDAPGGPGATGEPCAVHQDCQGICMNFWEGGYCSGPCHLSDPLCQPGSSCMNLGVHWSCAADCEADGDCRAAEGYVCHPDQKVCLQP